VLAPAQLFDGRYEIEGIVGSGGMGTVYRAFDRECSRRVALKVLDSALAVDMVRLAREAALLAELEHPSIVRYLAHRAPRGASPYLVMEWIEAEALAARLLRGRLSLEQSLTIGRRIAEALRVAHQARVVHRDVKPSHILLVDGHPDQAKLIDFGIAVRADAPGHAERVTTAGWLVGSCPYMSPELATGVREPGPRGDVFSLGCVLFECLTGRCAYQGASSTAILARIVWEDPPRVADLAREIPAAVDQLVASMMAKDARLRPDAASVVSALASAERGAPMAVARHRVDAALARILGSDADDDVPTLPDEHLAGPPGALAEEEQLMVWVVATGKPVDPGAPSGDGVRPLAASLVSRGIETATSFGGRFYALADGAGVALFSQSGAAVDDATRAARCAHALVSDLPGVPVALGSGRAVIAQRPVGQAIDRAVEALPRAADQRVPADDLSAGLLAGRFAITRDTRGAYVGPELTGPQRTRTLLGRSSPMVGRDRELALLEATFDECVSESAARGVLVLGEPGMGKSRLRDELSRRLRVRAAAPRTWLARGDPMREKSSFALAAEAVRSALSLRDGEPEARWRDAIARRVGELGLADPSPRVAAFLGELVGLEASGDHPELRAARRDARLMGDRVRGAILAWLAAECARAPIVLVLEDLHWGDQPSIDCIDAAFSHLADLPLFVLALARPGVKDRFPALFRGRPVSELRLPPLSARAAAQLVHAALGDAADDATTARVVDRAQGNAFYLEELIRAAAAPTPEAVPETVLAMVMARLDALEPACRRVLRAASVLGRAFPPAALGPLLDDAPTESIHAWLDRLDEQEFLTAGRDAGAAQEREYVFRHALVREACYQSLTPSDRSVAHRLAGAWLSGRPPVDAGAVAEHFERGGATAEAIGWYRVAAAHALSGNDLGAALAHVEHAVACGADGEMLGELLLLAAVAHEWRGEYAAAQRRATDALGALAEGSSRWFEAVGQLALISGRLGDGERVAAAAARLERFADAPSPGGSQRIATARLALQAFFGGNADLAQRAAAWLERAGPTGDPAVDAWMHRGREVQAAIDADELRELAAIRDAAACFEAAGDDRSAGMQRTNVACMLVRLGANAEAERELRTVLTTARRLAVAPLEAAALQNLGVALLRQGSLHEARAAEEQAVRSFGAQGDRRMECGARVYLARIHLASGAVGEAESEARCALVLAAAPALEVYCRAVLAHVELALHRSTAALALAEQATALLAHAERGSEGEALALLIRAEALYATGDRAAAAAAVKHARARLEDRARAIGDTALRASFLEGIPEHARTVALAAAWQ
jgi:tetratricopeptide (TPR) repeat protein